MPNKNSGGVIAGVALFLTTAVIFTGLGYMWGGMDARNSIKDALSRYESRIVQKESKHPSAVFGVSVPVSDEPLNLKEFGNPIQKNVHLNTLDYQDYQNFSPQ